MSNPIAMIMQMLQSGGNPMQLMNMFGGNPMMKQAQQMLNGGNDPRKIISNVAKQKGISEEQLKQMANQFGIKL